MAINLLTLLIMLTIVPSHRCYADDAAYYGDGVNVYPIEHADIQLLSEEIKITQGVGLGWGVDVTMNFKNHGPATTVQMGFPFDAYSPDEGTDESDEDTSDLSSRKPDPHFHTSVNGEELVVVKKTGIVSPNLPDIDFSTVYVFNVPFQKGETKRIRHTYTVGGYMNSVGERKFKYVLRTGALWKGPIDQIKISLALNVKEIPYLDCIELEESKAEKTGDTLNLHWDLRNIKPDRDLIISRNRGIELSAKAVDALIADNKESVMAESACRIRYLRNLVYASQGYPFKNQYVSAQFYYAGSPFKVIPAFAEKNIPQRYKEFIDYLSNIEKLNKQTRALTAAGLLPPDSVQHPNNYSNLNILVVDSDRKIAIGSMGDNIVTFTWPDLQPKGFVKMPANEGPCSAGFVSPNGRYFSYLCENQYPTLTYRLIVMDTVRFTVSSLKASYNDFVSKYLRYTKNSNVIVTATSAYDLTAGNMLASIPYDGGANERLIRGGEETNYFYRSNERDHVITLFDINTLAKAKTIKHDDYSSNLTISPNGKYLAGTFSRSELRGNSRVLINAYIRLLEMRGDELALLHEELLDQKDYHTELVFAKRNDVVFVIKGEGFYRYDIKKDGKVKIVNFNFKGINDKKSYLAFHYKNLQAYARRWDIETGSKTAPYWEMLYPIDSSRTFPFYEDSPLPVSFSTSIRYNSSDWVPASK